MITKHVIYLKLLSRNIPIGFNYPVGGIVVEFFSLILYLTMHGSQNLNRFLSVPAAKLLPGDASLYNPESSEVSFKAMRIFDILIATGNSEGLKADIDTDLSVRYRQWFDVNRIGEYGIPLIPITFDGNGIDFSFEGPVHLNLDKPCIPDIEPVILHFNTVTVGREGYRVEPVISLESREAGLLPMLDSTEECLETLIKPAEHVLGSTAIKFGYFREFLTKPLKLIGLIEIVKALMLHPVSIPAFLKGSIVKMPCGINHASKLIGLHLIRIEPVEKRLTHLLTLLHLNYTRLYIICQVILSEGGLAHSPVA